MRDTLKAQSIVSHTALPAMRVDQAVDMLIEYLLGVSESGAGQRPAKRKKRAQSGDEVGSVDGGSSNASKSARRKRRPPPDLSS